MAKASNSKIESNKIQSKWNDKIDKRHRFKETTGIKDTHMNCEGIEVILSIKQLDQKLNVVRKCYEIN